MAGFSNSIKRLSSSWVNQKEKQTLKKEKNQSGSGKITKKRHFQINIEKSKKKSKKHKKRH